MRNIVDCLGKEGDVTDDERAKKWAGDRKLNRELDRITRAPIK